MYLDLPLKHDRFADNNHVNDMIYYCFKYICKENEYKFVKAFKDIKNDDEQSIHTFRDLLVGAYLGLNGFNTKYEALINDKTPDWSIINEVGSTIGIVELTNFHIDELTSINIKQQIAAENIAGYWPDMDKNINRLYHSIYDKAIKYKNIANEHMIPYIVSAFIEFEIEFDSNKIINSLFTNESSLFILVPELSGVLFFRSSCSKYIFNYIENKKALRTLHLPVDNYILGID